MSLAVNLIGQRSRDVIGRLPGLRTTLTRMIIIYNTIILINLGEYIMILCDTNFFISFLLLFRIGP